MTKVTCIKCVCGDFTRGQKDVAGNPIGTCHYNAPSVVVLNMPDVEEIARRAQAKRVLSVRAQAEQEPVPTIPAPIGAFPIVRDWQWCRHGTAKDSRGLDDFKGAVS